MPHMSQEPRFIGLSVFWPTLSGTLANLVRDCCIVSCNSLFEAFWVAIIVRPELKLFRGDDLYYAGMLLLAVAACIYFVVRLVRFISERDAFDDEDSRKTIRQVFKKNSHHMLLYCLEFLYLSICLPYFSVSLCAVLTMRQAGVLTAVISVCLIARCIALTVGVFVDWQREINAHTSWFAHWYVAIPYYLVGEWLPNFLVLVVLRGQRITASEQEPLLLQAQDID